MKSIKRVLFFVICMMFCVVAVKAAPTYSFNVSANTIDEGKSVTASVTVRSTAAWNFRITSSGNTYGCSNVWADATNDANNTTKTFTTTCKASSIGTIVFSLSGDLTSSDGSSISLSGTKSVRVKEPTPASTINSLKSLTVEGYEINPEFSSDVLEYSVEVPSDKNTVNIKADKTDSRSSVEGIGEKEVDEGSNRFEIVVTAENGDKRTYILTVNVKDKNPINVSVNNISYTIVKNSKNLNIPDGFTEEKISINGEEVPCFKNDTINITLVALKDEKGNVKFFKYSDGNYSQYINIESANLSLYIMEKESVPYKGFVKENLKLNNDEINAFKYKNLGNYYLVYGMDLSNGKEGYYLFDINNNTFQLFDEELFNSLVNENNLYLYMFVGSLAVILICIIIILSMLKKNSKINKILNNQEKKEPRKVDNNKKEEPKPEEKKEVKMSDNKKLDMLFEDIEDVDDSNKKKKSKK